MDKEKLKKGLFYSLIIFSGLALAITYFFLLYSGNSIKQAILAILAVLRPFLLGAVFAYIMKSTCNFYEKHILKGLMKSKKRAPKTSRKIANFTSIILTYITWFLALSALLWIAVPQIIESITKFIQDLIKNMPYYMESVNHLLEGFVADHPDFAPYLNKFWEWVNNWVSTDLTPLLPQLGMDIVNRLINFAGILVDVVIGFVISAFLLANRKAFAKRSSIFLHCVFKEKTTRAIISEFKFADRMFGGFLEGKILDSTIIGIVYYIALTIMDIPYPALLAVICGVTNIIPIFGPFIGAIPSGFIILMSADHPIKVLYFVIFVCVIQFVDGYFIDPHIVGGNIKMSAFGVVFAVLLFGGLWGFFGLLIGVPTFAVICDIVKKIVASRLKKLGKTYVLRDDENSGGDKPNNNGNNNSDTDQKNTPVARKNEEQPAQAVENN